MSRWTLGPHRCRAFYWHQLRQDEKPSWRRKNKARAISIKADSTEFRVWASRRHVSTGDITHTCITLFRKNGAMATPPPTFARSDSKTYRGIVSSVDLPTMLPNGSQLAGGEPRLTAFWIDNRKANRVAIRHLIALSKSDRIFSFAMSYSLRIFSPVV